MRYSDTTTNAEKFADAMHAAFEGRDYDEDALNDAQDTGPRRPEPVPEAGTRMAPPFPSKLAAFAETMNRAVRAAHNGYYY